MESEWDKIKEEIAKVLDSRIEAMQQEFNEQQEMIDNLSSKVKELSKVLGPPSTPKSNSLSKSPYSQTSLQSSRQSHTPESEASVEESKKDPAARKKELEEKKKQEAAEKKKQAEERKKQAAEKKKKEEEAKKKKQLEDKKKKEEEAKKKKQAEDKKKKEEEAKKKKQVEDKKKQGAGKKEESKGGKNPEATAEQASTEKPPTEQASTEQPLTEQPLAEQPSTEQPSTEKPNPAENTELLELERFKDCQPEELVLSEEAKQVLSELAQLPDEELYVESKPSDEAMQRIKLVMQLTGKNISNDNEEDWEAWRGWIGTAKENIQGLQFNLDQENLDKVEALGTEIEEIPQEPFAQKLDVVVEEVLKFSGILKVQNARRYQRLLHKQSK